MVSGGLVVVSISPAITKPLHSRKWGTPAGFGLTELGTAARLKAHPALCATCKAPRPNALHSRRPAPPLRRRLTSWPPGPRSGWSLRTASPIERLSPQPGIGGTAQHVLRCRLGTGLAVPDSLGPVGLLMNCCSLLAPCFAAAMLPCAAQAPGSAAWVRGKVQAGRALIGRGKWKLREYWWAQPNEGIHNSGFQNETEPSTLPFAARYS